MAVLFFVGTKLLMTEGNIHTSSPFWTTISHFGITGTGSYPISMREPPAHYLALCEHFGVWYLAQKYLGTAVKVS